MRYGAAVVFIALCLCLPDAFGSAIFVKKDATGSNNGSSWTDAYTNLQDALAASSNDEIWVASAIYVPGTNRTDSFQLKSWVGLYGGFNGTETNRNERNWTNNVAVLSGDVLGDDAGFSNNTENVFHVVRGADNATIDGFVIRGANADGANPDDCGGGMFNYQSSPAVQNCAFSSNGAVSMGGGMLNYSCSASVQNCYFSGNVALSHGGGMMNYLASPSVQSCIFSFNRSPTGGGMENYTSSAPVVVDCVFSRNTATTGGAGMMNLVLAFPTIQNCIFSSNSAPRGAGMLNSSSSTPTVTNCVFSHNAASQYGGGMENNSCSPSVLKCVFSRNSAGSNGGGMVNISSSGTIEYCVFAGNYASGAGGAGGGMDNEASSSPTVRNCAFSANSATSYGGGMENYSSSPTVVNCVFSGNSTVSGAGIDVYASSSLVVQNCIFSGNSANYGGGMNSDSSSSLKVQNGVFCGNSATMCGGGMYNLSSSLVLLDSTFSGNSAPNGGALYNYNSVSVATNCILWTNSASLLLGAELFNSGSTSMVSCCDIRGGWNGPAVRNSGASTNIDEGGNINADPLYAVGTNGTWTQDATCDSNTFVSTLTDANASWAVNEQMGKFVQPDTSGNLQYVIVSNSATALAVLGNLSGSALNGKTYQICDYRLLQGSPCVDSGTNLAGVTNDFEWIPRPLDGNNDGAAVPDIGAHEFVHSDADTDHDRMKDADELYAGTDPTRSDSVLCLTGISWAGGNVTIAWQGGVQATQYLERSYNIVTNPVVWTRIYTNFPPTSPANIAVLAGGTNAYMYYRVGVPR